MAALLTWFCMSRAGVGKSCLLLRFSDDSFTPSFITTIGYVAAGDATAAVTATADRRHRHCGSRV